MTDTFEFINHFQLDIRLKQCAPSIEHVFNCFQESHTHIQCTIFPYSQCHVLHSNRCRSKQNCMYKTFLLWKATNEQLVQLLFELFFFAFNLFLNYRENA